MNLNKKIRVLVVEDSILFREVLAKGLSEDTSIVVVGKAGDPFEARDRIIELRPDVMTLDVEMPKMNGIEFLKKLMPQYPIPTVVVSGESSNVFDVMKSGAVEFVAKPKVKTPRDMEKFMEELVSKVKIASAARIGRQDRGEDHVRTRDSSGKMTAVKERENPGQKNRCALPAVRRNMVVAIGASTGGTEAIDSILKQFPENMPGVVIVQHMPPVFTGMYAERLDRNCRMDVKEAKDGDIVESGKVLLAPGGSHMKLVRSGSRYRVKVFDGNKVSGHCPSVDVLFNSIAECAGEKSIGIILTGMGTDGAKGMLALKEKGAYTIGQDEKTSVVYGMPKVAYNIGAVGEQKSLQDIPGAVVDYLKK